MTESTSKQPDTTKEPEKNPTNKLLVILCILLFITSGLLGWQLMEKNTQLEYIVADNASLEDQKNDLQLELEDMLSEYNALETDNLEMQKKIEEQKAEIEKLLDQVKENKGLKWQIYKLKKEAASLRKIMKGFVEDIDSLNTLNKGLRKENTEVKSQLAEQKTKAEELSEQNKSLSDKVDLASRFVISGLQTTGIKVKRDNTGKEVNRARRADKIRTCFTIMKNKVAKPGNHVIYVRILTPDGKVLSTGSGDANKFEFNSVKGLYSVKKTISYKNEPVQVCLDWKKTDEFVPGEYNVTVFHQGGDIGRTKFRLK